MPRDVDVPTRTREPSVADRLRLGPGVPVALAVAVLVVVQPVGLSAATGLAMHRGGGSVPPGPAAASPSRLFDLATGDLGAAEPRPDPSGPDRYSDALRRYVETLGAADRLDADDERTIRDQERVLSDRRSEALADLIDQLARRHRLAKDVFSGRDPAEPLRPETLVRLASAQRRTLQRAEDVVSVLTSTDALPGRVAPPRPDGTDVQATPDLTPASSSSDPEDRDTDTCRDVFGAAQVCHDEPDGVPGDCPDATTHADAVPGDPDVRLTCSDGLRLEVCGVVVVDLSGRDNTNCYAPLLVDLGGDDVHRGAGGGGSWDEPRSVAGFALDVLGDDRYDDVYVPDGPDPVAWSGAGSLGLGGLVDVQGDDTYAGYAGYPAAASGSAIQGAGFLIDLAGDDRYEATAGAVGGSVFQSGLGVLVDATGHDVHAGEGRVASGAAGMTPVQGTTWPPEDAVRGMTEPLGVAVLLDLAGDDEYRSRARYDEDAPLLQLGEWPSFPSRGASNGAVGPVDVPVPEGTLGVNPGFDARLVDLAGDDRYDGACGGAARNGDYGLLWDGRGTDVYCGGHQDRSRLPKPRPSVDPPPEPDTGWSSGPVCINSWCHTDVCFPHWFCLPPIPYPNALPQYYAWIENTDVAGWVPVSYGAQIDREPTDTETSARKLVVSPPRSVSETPCDPGRRTPAIQTEDRCVDAFALAGRAGRCLTNATTGIDDELQGEPLCSLSEQPVETATRDGEAERFPLVHRGRVLWQRGDRLHATDPYTQTVRPLARAPKLVDYELDGSWIHWTDESGRVNRTDLRSGRKEPAPFPDPEFETVDDWIDSWFGDDPVTDVEINARYLVLEVDRDVESVVCIIDRWRGEPIDRNGPYESGYCPSGRAADLSGSRVAYRRGGDLIVDKLHVPSWKDHLRRIRWTGWVTDHVLDGSLLAWIESDGDVGAHDLRTGWDGDVGDTGGLETGIAVTDSLIVWRKSWDRANWTEHVPEDPGPARRTVLVGCDVSLARDFEGSSGCDDGDPKQHRPDCSSDPAAYLCPLTGEATDWSCRQTGLSCEEHGEAEPVPGAVLGDRPVLLSDPLASDNVSAPSADGGLVAWQAGEDVRYVHALGPRAADLTAGMERCLASQTRVVEEVGEAELGQPDLDDDELGDCWAGRYTQVLGELLSPAFDLDCDTLSNLEEYRWQLHPVYDVPPAYAVARCPDEAVPESLRNAVAQTPAEVLFPRGRDLDMDHLIDGHEVRFVARATGGDVLRIGDVGNPTGIAPYAPNRNRDTDDDGVRDLEDRNSDSAVTEANPATDTIQDGIEVWLLDTFPDRGDSDCDLNATVCHGAKNMTVRDPDDVKTSPTRGTGDGVSDARELYLWLVDHDASTIFASEDELYRREHGQSCDPEFHDCPDGDGIDNWLLDPNADGDELTDVEECRMADENQVADGEPGLRGCEAGFNPKLWWIGPDTEPGEPHTGGLLDAGELTWETIKTRWADRYADGEATTTSSGRPAVCPSPLDADSDDDGRLDGADLDPCAPPPGGEAR